MIKLNDISAHQGKMNMQKMKDAGSQGVWIRGGVGSYHIDTRMKENVLKAIDADLAVGLYWVSHPGYPVKDHLEKWLFGISTLGDVALTLPHALDIERVYKWRWLRKAVSKTGKVIKKAQWLRLGAYPSEHLSSLNMQIAHGMKSFLPGITPIIYSNPNTINAYMKNPGWLKEYPFWQAQYGVNSPDPVAPWHGNDVWQHSADGNMKGAEYGAGGSKSIDINLLHVAKYPTLKDFQKRVGFDVDPEPIEEDPPRDLLQELKDHNTGSGLLIQQLIGKRHLEGSE